MLNFLYGPTLTSIHVTVMEMYFTAYLGNIIKLFYFLDNFILLPLIITVYLLTQFSMYLSQILFKLSD